MLAFILSQIRPPASTPPIVFVVSAVVAGIFGSGGIYALISARRQNRKLDAETIKLRGEADILPIDLAKGAVVVQADVIKNLREELARQDKKIDEQSRINEEQRARADMAANRADAAYRALREQCTKLQSDYAALLARFEDALDERDRWKDKANGAS